MSTIGLFFGTQTGNTEAAAALIQVAFGGEQSVVLHDVADIEPAELLEFDVLILGCPTWNIGELQSDWDGLYDELDALDFTERRVAYFGVGDQVGYADNFQDAMGLLEAKISGLGGQTIGYWPTLGYDFSASKAVVNGKFVGLALDDDNQPELTEGRIKTWVAQLKQELNL